MSEQQKPKLFREKSLEAIESPESLNDYLRVTSPGVWLVMATVIVLLAGGILWGVFGHIRTTAQFAVAVTGGKSVCYVPIEAANKVLARGVIRVEGVDYPMNTDADNSIYMITEDISPRVLLSGGLRIGDMVIPVPVITDLEDGYYTGEVVTEDLKPISLLLQ